MTDKNTLKLQSIKESISNIVADYEEKIADMRAEITIAVNQYEERIASLEAQLKERSAGLTAEGGEVVDDVVS